MLPFLSKKKIVTAIAQTRGKQDAVEVKSEITGDPLAEAARDFMRAMDDRSADSLAKAFKAAFTIASSSSPSNQGWGDEGAE